MNRFNSMTRPLIWFMTLLLVAFVTGCGGTGDTANPVSSSPKAITAYSISGSTGVINQTTKSIAVTVPYGTTLINQVATYTSTGSIVTVGATIQTSGTTPNNFTNPVTYIVTAADGTTATYIVTVTVAAATSKAISAFTFPTSTGTTINEAATPKTIAVTVPYGTGRTALVATFSSSGSSVTVVATGPQTSGTTSNNFSSPVAYIVTAANGTTATYNVTVTVAAAAGAVVCSDGGSGNCVNLGTAANYAILDQATVTFTPIATITTTPTITGNVGLSPAAASFITGFALAMDPGLCFSNSTHVTGNLFAADYSTPNGCTSSPDTATLLTTAVLDENNAYGFAAAKATAGGGLTTACPGAGAISDATDAGFPGTGLPAGVYTCGATAITIPGNLTLHGSATDVWVFKTAGTLSQTGATSVTLTGGALPQNVFWQAAGGVIIQSTAHIEGVILSGTNIQLITGATVTGRLFGTTGVLMDSNTVTQP